MRVDPGGRLDYDASTAAACPDGMGSMEREYAMYKTFMIVGLIVVGVGWAAYFLWDLRMRRQEARQPKQRSERLQKTQGEVSDWAKKMAQFKSPAPKKRFEGEQTEKG